MDKNSFLRTYADPDTEMQEPFDVSVIVVTILRPELRDALRSVFAQDLQGRVQCLVGIDVPNGDLSLLDEVCASRPKNCVVQVFYPGYSTSSRHGGLSPVASGGALRSILSYLANSPYLTYLDDDNWWRPDHLRLLRAALVEADWAYSLRWFVHPVTRRAICIDEWESIGPGQGIFQQTFDGFVDPNCLMFNKLVCDGVLPWWNRPMRGDPNGRAADRNIFAVLKKFYRGAATNQPTSYYQIDPNDGMHPLRLNWMGAAYESAARTVC